MIKTFFKSNWALLTLIFILLLGAYLRLHMIRNYMTFLGDEGRDVLVVEQMIVDHKFTLLGPTASVGGFFLGPIYYYFMLPFLWASRLDPVGPAIMVALFGIATIFLVYKTGKDFFDECSGLIAASIYAVSPLVIAYSRSSWNPNVVPFFAIALIYSLWKLVVKPGRFDGFLIGIILGIGLQLHYLFLFLCVLVGIWYLINLKKISFFPLVGFTFFGFLIGFSPYIAFEVRHGFTNSRSIIQFLLAGKDTGFVWGNFFRTVGDVIFRLFGRLIYRLPDETVWQNFPKWYITILVVTIKATIYIAILFFILVCTYFVKRARRFIEKIKIFSVFKGNNKSNIGSLLLVLWFITTVFLFGLYRKAIYDYYFGIAFPLPFLMIGYILSTLRKVRYGFIAMILFWMVLVVFNWGGRPFIYPPNNQLEQVKRIADVALSKTDGKPFNFALITDGNSDQGYRYFFEIAGRAPVTIQPVEADPIRSSVTSQLIVICETIECKPLGNSLWEIAGFGRADIVGEWSVPFVKIIKLVHYKGQ